jgi:hypothetical protein
LVAYITRHYVVCNILEFILGLMHV